MSGKTRKIQVDGRAARRVDTARGICRRIGADRTVDVLIQTHNEELNLPELAERVLRTFEVGGFRGELILVDDGSTDGTAAVIRTLSAAHPEAIVGVFHPRNRGMAEAWKSGTRAARFFSGQSARHVAIDQQLLK